MTIDPAPCPPILASARTAERALREVADLSATYLRTVEKADVLLTLTRLEAVTAELKLRVLAESGDVAEATGAKDAGTWLAHTAHVDSRTARADLLLAIALDEKYQAVAAGMRDGAVNLAQARVIVHALDALPEDLDPAIRASAEAHLVELAAHHDPRDLRILGAKILDVVAPEIAEAALGKALEREEQRARDKCSLRIKDLGDGISRITALVPTSIAARLTTYIDAEDSPRVTRSRSRGEALCRLLEKIDPKLLPDHGGDATTLVVTIDLETLLSGVGSALIDAGIDGQVAISATEARRLACNAGILPAVLNGKGEVLDLGRMQRFYNSPQRRAMGIMHKRCRAEGCRVPSSWCEAHHLDPWSRGGKTDLKDGVPFCSHHHHLAHDSRYVMSKLTSGDYRFHRRT